MKKVYIVLFILITLLLYFKVDSIIKIKPPENKTLNKIENTDVVFIGTSRVANGISPMYIWNKYKVVSYNLGTSGQSYKISYLLAKKSIEKYGIKYLVIDVLDIQERLDRYSSKTKDSLTLFNLIERVYVLKYLFNNKFTHELNVFNKYHTRWKEINKNDFGFLEYYKGLNDGRGKFIKSSVNSSRPKSNVELNEDTKQIINQFKDLEKQYGVNIIFIKLPNTKDDLGYDEALENYIKEIDMDFINYNLDNKLVELDYDQDFMEWNHNNLYGSYKVADHLVPYLIEKYQIPRHEHDKKYLQWDKDYIKYAREINAGEIREILDFNSWRKYILYDNYTVIISSNGDIMNKLPQDTKNFLKSKGLSKYETDKANMRYVATIDDNQVFFEEISEKPVEYKGRMKRKVNLLVKSDGNSIINVSGKPQSKNKYGLNMVVYDKVNKEVVDSIWIDPNKPNEIRR